MPDEPRPEKVAVVAEVRERFNESAAAILTEYRGLRVQEMATLRRALTAAGGEYKVYKNTLVRRAARETGLADLEPLLEGPTAIAFVRDDVAAVAKVLRDFAKTSPALVVKGGLVGRSIFDANAAGRLADLPSREALLSQFAGVLAAPMQRFASLLKAIPQSFAYGLSALIDARLAAGESLPVVAEDSLAAGEADATPSAPPDDETSGSADTSPADATPAVAAVADAAAEVTATAGAATSADDAGDSAAAPTAAESSASEEE